MKFLIMSRKEMKSFINKIHPFTVGIITISDTDKNNINITNGFCSRENLLFKKISHIHDIIVSQT